MLLSVDSRKQWPLRAIRDISYKYYYNIRQHAEQENAESDEKIVRSNDWIELNNDEAKNNGRDVEPSKRERIIKILPCIRIQLYGQRSCETIIDKNLFLFFTF